VVIVTCDVLLLSSVVVFVDSVSHAEFCCSLLIEVGEEEAAINFASVCMGSCNVGDEDGVLLTEKPSALSSFELIS
jgi:hypothetical protein